MTHFVACVWRGNDVPNFVIFNQRTFHSSVVEPRTSHEMFIDVSMIVILYIISAEQPKWMTKNFYSLRTSDTAKLCVVNYSHEKIQWSLYKKLIAGRFHLTFPLVQHPPSLLWIFQDLPKQEGLVLPNMSDPGFLPHAPYPDTLPDHFSEISKCIWKWQCLVGSVFRALFSIWKWIILWLNFILLIWYVIIYQKW